MSRSSERNSTLLRLLSRVKIPRVTQPTPKQRRRRVKLGGRQDSVKETRGFKDVRLEVTFQKGSVKFYRPRSPTVSFIGDFT